MEQELVTAAETVVKSRNPIVIACAATAAATVAVVAVWRRRRNRDEAEIVQINAPKK